jgi:hypothetical protein
VCSKIKQRTCQQIKHFYKAYYGDQYVVGFFTDYRHVGAEGGKTLQYQSGLSVACLYDLQGINMFHNVTEMTCHAPKWNRLTLFYGMEMA